MDTLTVHLHLKASPQEAWEAAMRPDLLAVEMPGVQGVEVLSREEEGDAVVQTVRWQGLIEAGPIRKVMVWVERDLWTREPLQCAFVQTEGTFKVYEGTWAFSAEEGGCHTSLTLSYDAGIPLVGAIIGKLLRKIVAENLQSLLNALAAVL